MDALPIFTKGFYDTFCLYLIHVDGMRKFFGEAESLALHWDYPVRVCSTTLLGAPIGAVKKFLSILRKL